MFTLGLIPARGQSKRFPRKNIAPCHGKPLIAWTIEAAKRSKLTDCIVSTDDAEIAEVSEKHGGNIAFIRPPELAVDTASSMSVVRHAAMWALGNLRKPDYVVLLQPTSPTRTTEDIDNFLNVVEHMRPQAMVSVNEDRKPDGLLYAYSWDLIDRSKDATYTIEHGAWLYYTGRSVPDIDFPEDLKAAEEELLNKHGRKLPMNAWGF